MKTRRPFANANNLRLTGKIMLCFDLKSYNHHCFLELCLLIMSLILLGYAIVSMYKILLTFAALHTSKVGRIFWENLYSNDVPLYRVSLEKYGHLSLPARLVEAVVVERIVE